VRERPDLELVGSAADGREALAQIRELNTSVAVLDLRLPELDGLQVLAALHEADLPTQVVLVSAFVDGAIVHQALVAGASGYVAKDADEETVCEAVIAASSGETAISPDLQAGVVRHVRGRAEAEAALSPRELQILELLASGRTAPQIGRELHLSADTVKTYARRVYDKLGVRNAAEAVAEGMRRGLLD
jgi:two-component system nitrate/nitrite response regulator NarL